MLSRYGSLEENGLREQSNIILIIIEQCKHIDPDIANIWLT
jgi:hypothetical protein